jgi:hypothetical protein
MLWHIGSAWLGMRRATATSAAVLVKLIDALSELTTLMSGALHGPPETGMPFTSVIVMRLFPVREGLEPEMARELTVAEKQPSGKAKLTMAAGCAPTAAADCEARNNEESTGQREQHP